MKEERIQTVSLLLDLDGDVRLCSACQPPCLGVALQRCDHRFEALTPAVEHDALPITVVEGAVGAARGAAASLFPPAVSVVQGCVIVVGVLGRDHHDGAARDERIALGEKARSICVRVLFNALDDDPLAVFLEVQAERPLKRCGHQLFRHACGLRRGLYSM